MLVIIQFITSFVKPQDASLGVVAIYCSFLYHLSWWFGMVQVRHFHHPGRHLNIMDTELPPEVASTFSPALVDALLEGLESVYDELPTSAEMPGFDNTLAGQAIYRLPQHWLPELAGEFGVEVVHENNALIYRVGSQVFTCQRVADTAQSIRGVFPRSFKACLQYFHDYNLGQMYFDFMEVNYDVDPPLVLAHMGNRKEGLIGAYLCSPSIVEEGKIRGWAFAYELLKPKVENTVPPSDALVPAVEEVVEAQVRPRRERSDGTEA